MVLGYERVDHLVAISAAKKSRRIRNDYPITNDFLFLDYSNYVKSQVHLNVSSDLYDRPLSEYAKALRYLNGSMKYYSSALKVLRYYYLDMGNFLVNNQSDVRLQVNVDYKFDVPEIEYDFDSVKDEILTLVSAVKGEKSDDLVSRMKSFSFQEILDKCNDSNDIEQKINSYTMAAILLKEANSSELKVVRVKGDNIGS